jgi:hypothetical protein
MKSFVFWSVDDDNDKGLRDADRETALKEATSPPKRGIPAISETAIIVEQFTFIGCFGTELNISKRTP